jgi:hypothetical protein
VILTARIVDVKDDEIGTPGAVDVGDSNSGTLVLSTKPAGHGENGTPAGCSPDGIEVPPNPVVTMVLATRVVKVKHDEVWPAGAADVRHGNAGTLVLGSKPAGNRERTSKEPGV